MNLVEIARSYVVLTHQIGLHHQEYVDAYYGPEELEPAECSTKDDFPLASLAARTDELLVSLGKLPDDDETRLRREFLRSQLGTTKAAIRFISGERVGFDQEVREMYGVNVPKRDDQFFLDLHQGIETTLEKIENNYGLSYAGSLGERLEQFSELFRLPDDKVEAAMQLSCERAKQITSRYVNLLEGESIDLQFKRGVPWSGYNYYQGGFRSLIATNLDNEVSLASVLTLGVHEAYPGHHTYNIILEELFVNERGWVELSIFAMFGPMGTIFEGLAMYAEGFALTKEEKRDLIVDLARETGIDERLKENGVPEEKVAEICEAYVHLSSMNGDLKYAAAEAGRMFYEGVANEEIVQWMMDHELITQRKAKSRIHFFETYGSYIATYNAGRDLVTDYIEARVGQEDLSPEEVRDFRWGVYVELLETPPLPERLQDYGID